MEVTTFVDDVHRAYGDAHEPLRRDDACARAFLRSGYRGKLNYEMIALVSIALLKQAGLNADSRVVDIGTTRARVR